jgi:hypothetical protein
MVWHHDIPQAKQNPAPKSYDHVHDKHMLGIEIKDPQVTLSPATFYHFH